MLFATALHVNILWKTILLGSFIDYIDVEEQM